jgi:glycerol-3-phosphate dehydrogenase
MVVDMGCLPAKCFSLLKDRFMNSVENRLKTQVLIIGGGITGVGLARDLALRGLKCLIVEKTHINAGASGANQGLLHSGARYVMNDPETARECKSETELLKRLAPGCCEDTGGLFVAIECDSENYIADFPHLCARSGIETGIIDCGDARELEPELSDKIIAAYRVADGSVDPFRLSFDNLADAMDHGTEFLSYCRVAGFIRNGDRIQSVKILRLETGTEIEVEAEQIVNASGAWAGQIARLAGLDLPVVWSKGSMLITQPRITERVINRLHPPANGDIIMPGGTVSLLGTTSMRVSDVDNLHVGIDEADFIVEETSKLVPEIQSTRIIRGFAGVRPLIGSSETSDDREISRSSRIIDHERDGIRNLITLIGAKLTTYRLTAERAADLICARMGVTAPCLTKDQPLPASPLNGWVVAGVAPRLWLNRRKRRDALLCQCELVPESAISEIVELLRATSQKVDLDAIRLHSRMGKGTCQGAFCGMRTAGFLYDLGCFRGGQGIESLKSFLETRWKGTRPVLWGRQMVQEQLQEAIHCGLFNLEECS